MKKNENQLSLTSSHVSYISRCPPGRASLPSPWLFRRNPANTFKPTKSKGYYHIQSTNSEKQMKIFDNTHLAKIFRITNKDTDAYANVVHCRHSCRLAALSHSMCR